MSELEYQHIVPRTYFKPWENPNSNRKLNIVNKTTGEVKSKSSEREFGIKDFYTITIDNYFIFNEEDKKIAYKPLLEYEIEFENRKLISIEDFHKNIGMFEEWLICDKDENKVRNSVVYQILKSIRILDLEKNWNLKAENNWNTTIQKIVSSIKTEKPLTSIEYDFLYLFLASQKIRTKKFKDKHIIEPINDVVTSVLNMPDDIKERKQIENDLDKMFDSIFKKIIRDFQEGNNDSKPVEAVNNYIEKFSMIFYYNDNKSFYTSDNPIIEDVAESLPSKYKGQIFPLAPHLIVIGYKGDKMDNRYQVHELSDDEVDKVNNLIINNAIEKYITD